MFYKLTLWCLKKCSSAAAFGENGALDSKEDNLFASAPAEVSKKKLEGCALIRVTTFGLKGWREN